MNCGLRNVNTKIPAESGANAKFTTPWAWDAKEEAFARSRVTLFRQRRIRLRRKLCNFVTL